MTAKQTPLNDLPEYKQATADRDRIAAERDRLLAEVDRLETEIAGRAAPGDVLLEALEMVASQMPDDDPRAEVGQVRLKIRKLDAGLRAADEAVDRARRHASTAHMRAQAGTVLKALDRYVDALRTMAAVDEPFAAIRAEALALGYDPTAGGLPMEVHLGCAHDARERLPRLEMVREALADTLDATLDAKHTEARALVDLPAPFTATRCGQRVKLPLRLARQWRRDGYVDLHA